MAEEPMDKLSRKGFIAGAAAALTTLTGCAQTEPTLPSTEEAATTEVAQEVDLREFSALEFDNRAWHYDSTNKCWWQLGVEYCTKPATEAYENLAIYVPSAYLKPVNENVKLEDASETDAFEVEIDPSATIGAFNASNAPICLPINAPNYAAQTPASAYLYDGLGDYLNAGMVYVYVGFRGRSSGYDNTALTGDGFFVGGCPWAVTELKSAVRYLRYNAAVLPGDTNRIIAFGLGSGGLLAEVLGASGSSELYTPYLTEIGAATHDAEGNFFGDEICAVAAWCPDTAAVHADETYEWELGQFAQESPSRAEGTWTKQLSEDLAGQYATYLNSLSLTDSDGNQLYLDETDGGIYTDGTYYEYLISLAEESAAKFLTDSEFPATVGGIDQPSGYFPGSGKSVEELMVTFGASTTTGTMLDSSAADASDAESDGETSASAADIAVADTYPPNGALEFLSRSDYINALNSEYRWISYNESRSSVRISGLASYVSQCRPPALGVPAFDSLDTSSQENQLFGNSENETLHFSQDIEDVLSQNADAYAQLEGYDSETASDWQTDLAELDSLEQPVETRCNMYNPLFFVNGSSEAYGSATVAKYWRLNLGMAQVTTPLAETVNLALSLQSYDGVNEVSLIPVWEAPRSLAEPGNTSAPEAFGLWVSSLFTE